MGYVYIGLTIILTVYGQIIIKWRLNLLGQLPEALSGKFSFLINAVIDPYIFSSFVAAFLASLTWMAAITRFELSYAYPFMSLAFVLVLLLSYFLFNETITLYKIFGMAMIISGIVIASRN